jgi:hypothetical protein
MSYKLFIDDDTVHRGPPEDGAFWRWATNSAQAIDMITTHGVPYFISFDHDLGGDDTSMVFLNWFVEHIMNTQTPMPQGFDFYVHSQNPIGAADLNGLMGNFIKHCWRDF